MSTTVDEFTPDEGTTGHDDTHDDHMSDWGYVKVAIFLGAVTAVEVFTYFNSVLDWGKALVPALLVMMVIKFGTVVAYFMHLKFDSQMFTRVFVAGLALAIGVYVIMLLTFALDLWEIFQD
ncbi:MAG: cytochrome C oxidase subunit IV family protein [Acidimicrobiia bacterium]|nr:cytochrome C oxidase subunit IV family protein [Acidimicrobiia bacterium]